MIDSGWIVAAIAIAGAIAGLIHQDTKLSITENNLRQAEREIKQKESEIAELKEQIKRTK